MNDVARIVIVDDDRAIRWVLERALAQPDLDVTSFERADTALEEILSHPPDVLLTDIRMPGLDGLGLMARVRDACPDLPVIVMTAHSDLDSAVASYQGGAFEYLPKPFDVEAAGHTHLLEEAVPDFERILLETALKHTRGRKGEAAELLGWGRNTLARKVKVLLPALAEE